MVSSIDLLNCVIFLLAFLTFLKKVLPTRTGIPKGPLRYPFLGNIPQIANKSSPKDQFQEWAKLYGALYTVYIGTQPALVINDTKLLKKLFSQSAGSGKFKNDTFLLMVRGPYGQVLSEGAHHTEQRVHFMKILKHFEFGSWKVDRLILPQVESACDLISSQISSSGIGRFYPERVLKETIINTLWTLATGENCESQDCQSFIKILSKFEVDFSRTMKTGLGFCPWLKTILPKWSGYQQLDATTLELNHLVRNIFKRIRLSKEDNCEPRHFIDCYINALDEAKTKPQSTFYGDEGLNHVFGSVTEFFIGGVLTQSSTLTMLVYYLSFNENVQKNLQDEIDKVIGRERSPSLNDRSKMPYAEATILEAIRILSVTQLGLFHELIEDIHFDGYNLQKGMPLIPNLYWIQHNPEIWGDPHVFRPERFIENPKLREHVVAFQPGKRSCPGEPVAKDIMFLVTTGLYQRFETNPDQRITESEYLKTDDGVGAMPGNHPVLVQMRN